MSKARGRSSVAAVKLESSEMASVQRPLVAMLVTLASCGCTAVQEYTKFCSVNADCFKDSLTVHTLE